MRLDRRTDAGDVVNRYALSIRQPWAWLIVRPDLTGELRKAAIHEREIKDVENRDWPTRYRGPILIHASKGMTRAEYEDAADFASSLSSWELPRFEDLPRGGIVGRARIVDCVTQIDSRWFVGRFGFVLTDVEPLPFVPCRGALGLFPVPQDVLDRLHDCDGTSTHDYEGAGD